MLHSFLNVFGISEILKYIANSAITMMPSVAKYWRINETLIKSLNGCVCVFCLFISICVLGMLQCFFSLQSILFLINFHPKFHSIVIFIPWFLSLHVRASYRIFFFIHASIHRYIICRHLLNNAFAEE